MQSEMLFGKRTAAISPTEALELSFPQKARCSRPVAAVQDKGEFKMGQPVVLLAEDEPMVRQLIAFTLEQENFIVLPASNAVEALQIFHSNRDVDLLVTDIRLGTGMNGVELAERIQTEKPTAKVLLISGYPESEVRAAEKGVAVLSKPFLPTVLVERVRKLLAMKVRADSEMQR